MISNHFFRQTIKCSTYIRRIIKVCIGLLLVFTAQCLPDNENIVQAATKVQLSSFTCAEDFKPSKQDCEVLIDFYNKTGGDGWAERIRTKWFLNQNACDNVDNKWQGVTCENGTITQLYFSGGNLSGTIPPSIGKLSGLQIINFEGNLLSGSIPVELIDLQNLQTLDLSANKLSGSIPAKIGNLKKLHDLELDNNVLSGLIPQTIIQLESCQSNDEKDQCTFKFDYNLLSFADSTANFLDRKNQATTWGKDTQTVTPSGLSGYGGTRTINLRWQKIKYERDNGYYEISYESINGKTTITTENKSTEQVEINNLKPDTSYVFKIRTFSESHPPQKSDLWSEYSESVTIITLPEFSFDFDPKEYQVIEAKPQVQVTVTLSMSLPDSKTLYFRTEDGSATGGKDYESISSGKLEFAKGETTATFFVNIIDDREGEGTETINLVLFDKKDGSDKTATISISDNDRITVVDEAGNHVGNANVLLYRNGDRKEQRCTDNGDANKELEGTVSFPDMRNGDQLLVLALQHIEPTTKSKHDSAFDKFVINCDSSSTQNGEQGWSYRVYATNIDINPTGEQSTLYTVTATSELTLKVKKSNPLVLYNLVVSVEWNAYKNGDENDTARDSYLQPLRKGISDASNFLYDVTDGQFAFGQVTIYDNGRYWNDADLQILASNNVRPSAQVGGIVDSPFTPTVSSGKELAYYPGTIRMGRTWNGVGAVEGEVGNFLWYRTLVHEFAHYALYLYDEYFGVENDKINPTHCTDQNGHIIPNKEVNNGIASIMDWQYTASELWILNPTVGSEETTERDGCTATNQWLTHGESDWDTVIRIYSQKSDNKVTFNKPIILGEVSYNPGPDKPPVNDIPLMKIERGSEGPDRFSVKTSTVSQKAELYTIRNGPEGVRIIEQGTPDSNGNINLLGAKGNDRVVALSWDGLLTASANIGDLNSGQELKLDTTKWNPRIDVRLSVSNKSLIDSTKQISIDLTIEPNAELGYELQSLEVRMLSLDGTISQTLEFESTANGVLASTIAGTIILNSEDGTDKALGEGFIWLKAVDTGKQERETITSYSVGGSPTSHIRFFISPIESGSVDGNVHLNIPDGVVDEDAVVIVMPSKGMPKAPRNLEIVGSPITIRSSSDFKNGGKGVLQMYYLDNSLVDESTVQICRLDDTLAAPDWDCTDTDSNGNSINIRNNNFNIVSRPIDRFGVYAVMALAPEKLSLTEGWNVVSFSTRNSISIASVFEGCEDAIKVIYNLDSTDALMPWKKYVFKAPPYINTLQSIEPGKGYIIDVLDPSKCTLFLDGKHRNGLADIENISITASGLQANALPIFPSSFYGEINYDENDESQDVISPGRTLAARVNGVAFTTVITTYDESSVYSVDILGDVPETSQIEGGASGQSVSFEIDKNPSPPIVDQIDITGTWQSAEINDLPLTVVPRYLQYLPVIFAPEAPPELPDLTVKEIRMTGNNIEVTVINQGKKPVESEFWVDLYLAPVPIPNAVNQTWPKLSMNGAAWAVTSPSLAIDPGEQITLTLGDAYYSAAHSKLPDVIATGTKIYVQVDSSDPLSMSGAIQEGDDETDHYNNVSSVVVTSPIQVPGNLVTATQERTDTIEQQR